MVQLMTNKKHGGRRTGAGREPINAERGALVPVLVKVFPDQRDRLKAGDKGQSETVRDALDRLFSEADSAK